MSKKLKNLGHFGDAFPDQWNIPVWWHICPGEEYEMPQYKYVLSVTCCSPTKMSGRVVQEAWVFGCDKKKPLKKWLKKNAIPVVKGLLNYFEGRDR